MKFEKKKVDGLNGPVMIFSLTAATDDPMGFEIWADKRGIQLRGYSPPLEGESDLQDLAKVVSDAWREHLKMKPRLITE